MCVVPTSAFSAKASWVRFWEDVYKRQYVDIVSIGILDGNGKSNLAALEFALESLINSDVSIINMSLAFNILVDQKLYRILKKLSEQNVTIIASMSNEGNVSYPAASDNVIGVRRCV